MNKESRSYPETARILIYLLACAINEKECKIKPDQVDFEALYALAQKHAVCSAVAFALESAGIEERRFTQAKLKAKRKLGLFDIEREKIFEKLTEAGIWYLPLKGIVIKEFYPVFGMREMSDNDILCDKSKMAEVREIMETLGYSCESYGVRNHDAYQKLPVIEIEMHHSLFWAKDNPEFDNYYADVFDRLVHKDGCEYAFTDEDFYIYMLAHTYKHFSNNGTGLRPLMDIYLYLQAHPSLDFETIGKELEKLRLTKFEQLSRQLVTKLFGFQPLSEEDRELLSLFMNSSIYGSVRQGEYNRLTRMLDGSDARSAKMKYLFDRFFMNGEALENNYPFFAAHKRLLPALYIFRLFRGLFTHPKKIAHEIKNVVRYTSPKNRI